MDAMAIADTRIRNEMISSGVGHVRFNDYWGEGRRVTLNPQAFLVHLEEPGAVLKAHMHDVDQFQVAVDGGGKIGAFPWRPVSVHYADAYTVYGPIVRGDEGLSFYTLRMMHGGGNWQMPGARELMVNGRPGRNLKIDVDQATPFPSAGASLRRYLAEPKEDGLAVAEVLLGPGAEAEGYAPAGGQYMLVTRGALSWSGRSLSPMSLLMLRRGEPAPVLTAGEEGAAVVVMQFPVPSARKGSDPEKMAHRSENYESAHSSYTDVDL